jgi:hypothetical protein
MTATLIEPRPSPQAKCKRMSVTNEPRERPDARKVRYAVVGAGWISREDFMPWAEHTGNSVITASVTGDPTKAKAFAKRYAIPRCR